MKNILLADDQEVTRRGIHALLKESYGQAEIFEASNVKIVREQILKRNWDLILLDVMISNDDIIDVINEIRSTHKTVPILMLTISAKVDNIVKTMKAGANGFIHKYRATGDFLEAIKKVSMGETYLHSETAAEIAKYSCEQKPQLAHQKLSNREMEVFRLIALGRTVKEIAVDLDLSEKTVATHLARAKDKMGLASAVEIARYALLNGLVD